MAEYGTVSDRDFMVDTDMVRKVLEIKNSQIRGQAYAIQDPFILNGIRLAQEKESIRKSRNFFHIFDDFRRFQNTRKPENDAGFSNKFYEDTEVDFKSKPDFKSKRGHKAERND
ncbi:hypothetical protein SUGI_0291510 [Cryptomeria japonica]|nr:hypothetical protein SUGI_0291510 [Cryptomeria japonica]